jgi:hypothetical protein
MNRVAKYKLYCKRIGGLTLSLTFVRFFFQFKTDWSAANISGYHHHQLEQQPQQQQQHE